LRGRFRVFPFRVGHEIAQEAQLGGGVVAALRLIRSGASVTPPLIRCAARSESATGARP